MPLTLKKTCGAALMGFALLSTPLIHAAPPSEELVRELLVVSDMPNGLEQTKQKMLKLLEPQLATMGMENGRELTGRKKELFEDYKKKMFNVINDEMSWNNKAPVYISMYQGIMTAEEVQGLVAFYKTPAGRSAMKKIPLVIQFMDEDSQTYIPLMFNKMTTLSKEFGEKLKTTQ